MAYNSRNLSVIAYANGFTLWHYTTIDQATDVDTTGYFNAAADMLRTGDFIFANVSTSSVPGAGVFVVKSNSGGVVNCHNLTAFATADTD